MFSFVLLCKSSLVCSTLLTCHLRIVEGTAWLRFFLWRFGYNYTVVLKLLNLFLKLLP